jgi:sulfur relay (sulfurtransferase) DsrF/TusC family protein
VKENYRRVENFLIIVSVLYKNKMRKTVIFVDEAWFTVSRNENPHAVLEVSTNFNDCFKLIPMPLCAELSEEESV